MDWWLPAFVATGYVVANRLIRRSFLVWCAVSVGVGAVIADWWAVLLVLPDFFTYWVLGPTSGHLEGWRATTVAVYTFHAVLLGLGAVLGSGAL